MRNTDVIQTKMCYCFNIYFTKVFQLLSIRRNLLKTHSQINETYILGTFRAIFREKQLNI